MGIFDDVPPSQREAYESENKMTDEREPTIVDRVERLRKLVTLQGVANDQLEEKLAYFLSPEFSKADDGDDKGVADYPRSQIEETLIVLEGQFAYQTRRTHEILARVNL